MGFTHKNRNQPVEEIERKCLLCSPRKIESEIHFITQCSFFEKKTYSFHICVKINKGFQLSLIQGTVPQTNDVRNRNHSEKLSQFVYGRF